MTSAFTTTAHRRRAGALGVALATALSCAAAAAGRQAVQTWQVVAERPAVTPPDAVPIVAWAGLAAAVLWATALVVLAVVRLLRRRQTASRMHDRPQSGPAPAVARVAALLLLLTGAVCGQSGALAAPVSVALVQPDRSAGSGDRTTLDGTAPNPSFRATPDADCADDDGVPTPGWTPPRPKPVAQCAVDSTPLVTGSTHDVDRAVVVHRGDSLWSLVARHLGADADPAMIAQVWPSWYAANRAVIGADPNRLLPGEVLQVPDTQGSAR
ncbi:LysM peptidoglycan-binding domain-containing protein [Leekyejoonella antrihumi]|uniref:LysM peptidoglycan-binding domain-containing protein n=1 Tax=Leekyejoonella antrihumi TaxID=1660198 RepID=A0A563DYB0_9MICO|nr:hypothetical protein [Leekyejoonella antrihumi]TWP35109.1 hypothetical protein FGL98_15280 [Leekyejoonella antrihumi]